jgi:hypothetical protein
MADQDVIDTIIAEAGGEGEAGLIAAAWSLQQRAAARGLTLDQAIRQSDQFDGYSKPGFGSKQAQQDPNMRARVERIVQGVTTGAIPNPVPGADHFISGTATPAWAKNMTLVATIGGHRFYASGNVPKAAYGVAKPETALAAIAKVAPASSANLASLRMSYAAGQPAASPQRLVTSSPNLMVSSSRRATTDDIIRNSAVPAVDERLQAVLNARYPSQLGSIGLQAATEKKALMTAAKAVDANAGATRPVTTPTTSKVTSEGLNVRPVTTVAIDPATGMPASASAAPSARVAGVSDVGYPYSYKAFDALRPRASIMAATPAKSEPKSLGAGYNAVTMEQRNAMSALPAADRLSPTTLPDTALTTGTLQPKQMAEIGVGLGNNIDPATGRRVTVPNELRVEMPRPRPSVMRAAQPSQPVIMRAAQAPPPIIRQPVQAPRIQSAQPGRIMAGARSIEPIVRGGTIMSPSRPALPTIMRGTNGYLYAQTTNGPVNVGRDPNASALIGFSAGRPTAFDRMMEGRSNRDDTPQSLVG